MTGRKRPCNKDWIWLGFQWDGKCKYCRKTLTRYEVSIDHVIPRSKGGRNEVENMVISCHWCNTAKAAAFLSEYLKP